MFLLPGYYTIKTVFQTYITRKMVKTSTDHYGVILVVQTKKDNNIMYLEENWVKCLTLEPLRKSIR